MKAALVQMNPTVGDVAGNERRMGAVLAQWGNQVDLLVFPELALVGYNPMDLLERPGFVEGQWQALVALQERTAGLRATVAVGCVLKNHGPGRPFFNGLALLANGRLVGTYRKRLLPTYNIFAEARHFEPGRDNGVFTVAGVRVGFLVCEDGWNHPQEGRYEGDPVAATCEAGAQVLVMLNASPGSVGKAEKRLTRFGRVARNNRVPLLYVNQVGGNDEVVFDGHGFALDEQGEVALRMPGFDEAVSVVEVTEGQVRALTPGVAWEEGREAFFLGQLTRGLRDYLDKCGFSRVVVGVSGGIDSALVLALAREVLPPERVAAVAMPSPYSSPGSLTDAQALCDNLGVTMTVAPIRDEFELAVRSFSATFGEPLAPLARQNLQARIRGRILMAVSNHFGHLLLSTGNKSELSVGYATLYGDMSGGLSVIGDLYKMEVYALARHINERHGRVVIPQATLDKEPSAELAPGQRDQDDLPPYPVLDAFLKLTLEGAALDEEERNGCEETLRQVAFTEGSALLRRVDGAEFKRFQAPPILRVHERAFGAGRRVPIARGVWNDRNESAEGENVPLAQRFPLAMHDNVEV